MRKIPAILICSTGVSALDWSRNSNLRTRNGNLSVNNGDNINVNVDGWTADGDINKVMDIATTATTGATTGSGATDSDITADKVDPGIQIAGSIHQALDVAAAGVAVGAGTGNGVAVPPAQFMNTDYDQGKPPENLVEIADIPALGKVLVGSGKDSTSASGVAVSTVEGVVSSTPVLVNQNENVQNQNQQGQSQKQQNQNENANHHAGAVVLFYGETCPDCELFRVVWEKFAADRAKAGKGSDPLLVNLHDPEYAAPAPFQHYEIPAVYWAEANSDQSGKEKLKAVKFSKPILGNFLDGIIDEDEITQKLTEFVDARVKGETGGNVDEGDADSEEKIAESIEKSGSISGTGSPSPSSNSIITGTTPHALTVASRTDSTTKETDVAPEVSESDAEIKDSPYHTPTVNNKPKFGGAANSVPLLLSILNKKGNDKALEILKSGEYKDQELLSFVTSRLQSGDKRPVVELAAQFFDSQEQKEKKHDDATSVNNLLASSAEPKFK